MPTIIDALIVTLGLDDAKFRAGSKRIRDDQKKLKDSAEDTGKGLEKSAKRGLEAFTQLRREVLGLLTIFTAGIGLKQFVSETVDSVSATGRLAHNLDMSTESLSAWQGVLKRNGGSAEDANASFQMLADTLQEVQLTGTTSKAGFLTLAGLRASDLKDSQQALLKMADTFSKMDPQRAAWIGKSLGLPQSTINVLEKGRGAVQAMLDEQRKIGVVTQADVEAAQKLQNTLSSLKQSFTAIGRAILTAFAPAIDVVAKVMTSLGEAAQRHKPMVVGAFAAMAAAAAVLGLVIAADALPFIALGAAVGVVGAAIGALIARFPELGAAFGELWEALKGVFGAFVDLGKAIAKAFGADNQNLAKAFADFLVNEVHAIADALHVVTDILQGKWGQAWKDAKETWRDMSAGFTQAGPARASRVPVAAANGNASPVASAAASMIAGFEGFIDHAKWDRNAYRLGFGSDTVTDPRTGQVSKVTASTTVTREAAQADLARRVQSEFMPKVAAAVGAAWSKFNTTTKAALTSIAYNYGSLPRDVLAAARAGDATAVAAAIRGHAMDKAKGDKGGETRGINAKRRNAEANAILASNATAANGNAPVSASGAAVAARAQAAASGGTVNHNSVQIDQITVQTRATDAQGIARDLGPAIQQRSQIATQANTGLS